MENTLGLQLKEVCKRSFTCLEKRKFIKPKKSQCWFIGHTQCVWAWVHVTATKGSWQTLRKFVKWDCSFCAALTGTPASQRASRLLPRCPTPGFAGQPLTAPCAFSCLCLSTPSAALGRWLREGCGTACPLCKLPARCPKQLVSMRVASSSFLCIFYGPLAKLPSPTDYSS